MLIRYKRVLNIFLIICLLSSMICFNTVDVYAAKNARGGIAPGGNFTGWTDAQLTTFLNDFDTTNATYIRVDLAWSVIQSSNSSTWNWTNYDRVINAIVAKGFKVIALPTYAPAWANGGYADDKYPPTSSHATDWYNFVKACADRYIPKGVDAWELWNEPNITAFWKPTANVANYTNIVLKQGSNAIRTSASVQGKTVTIITAGLSPAATNGSDISPVDFVTGIYANGGKTYFDAVGHHPYCFPSSPNVTEAWSAFQQTININQVMVNNGDGSKKIWGTEVGYHTGSSGDGVTQALQAQYLTEAYTRWNSWSFTGPLIWYSYQDTGTNPNDREQNFGMKTYSGTYKPAWQSYKNAMATTTTVFSSGLESGQTLPTWSDSVDYKLNVSGYLTGGNPECSIRTGEQYHSGSASLMFSGNDGSATSSYCVYKVFDVNIPISSGTKLSYWFLPQQENGRHVIVDMVCTDGTNLRDQASVDQNNIRFHPSIARGTIGAWNQVVVNAGQWLNGKTIDKIVVGYDQGPATGQYRGYIDDIYIYN